MTRSDKCYTHEIFQMYLKEKNLTVMVSDSDGLMVNDSDGKSK